MNVGSKARESTKAMTLSFVLLFRVCVCVRVCECVRACVDARVF